MTDLTGRVAIVTGGGRGIGREHCLELARHGASIVVNDLGGGLDGGTSADNPASEVVEAIRSAGGNAVANLGSVTSWDDCKAMVDTAVDSFGRLDIVVNNAGIVRDRMITSMSELDFDAVIAVHLKGTFNLVKHSCAHWREQSKAGARNSGRIINTTSAAGLVGNVGQLAYGSAKAGIAAITRITALEMSRYGVTSNAISPLAATRMTANVPGFSPEERPADDVYDPLHPRSASGVVAYLASEESGWITGQVLRIEGNVLRRFQPWSLANGGYRARAGSWLQSEELHDAVRSLFEAFPAGIETSSGVLPWN